MMWGSIELRSCCSQYVSVSIVGLEIIWVLPLTFDLQESSPVLLVQLCICLRMFTFKVIDDSPNTGTAAVKDSNRSQSISCSLQSWLCTLPRLYYGQQWFLTKTWHIQTSIRNYQQLQMVFYRLEMLQVEKSILLLPWACPGPLQPPLVLVFRTAQAL